MARRSVWTVLLLLTMLLSLVPVGTGAALAELQTPTVGVAQDASLGTILTGPTGMTLYRFQKDTPGVSNCIDQCEKNWPPLLVKAGEQPMAPAGLQGTLGTAARKDGSMQVTYNGAPLYYWVKDKAAGDTTGQNVNNLWSVVNPDAPMVKVAQDAKMGTILTDAHGMTLYVFTKDTPGTTNCYGQCAVNWPQLLVKEGEILNAPAGLGGTLGTTKRTDGSMQVTLNGAPLYYWVKDKAAGDTTGHKVQGVWFVAEPGIMLDAAGTWGQSQIAQAVRSGWAKGQADGKFHPNDQVTRAEFQGMLTAAFKTPAGTESLAEPDRAITRAEAIVMLVQALGLDGKMAAGDALAGFTDVMQLTEAQRPLVGVAVAGGFVSGYPDHTIRGEKTATRAEAVSLILRAMQVKK